MNWREAGSAARCRIIATASDLPRADILRQRWMAVVVGRKNTPARLEPTRKLLRAIKTFGERSTVGMEVAGDTTISRQKAVRKAAERYNRSERYVWGTVKLGRQAYSNALVFLEKEVGNRRSRPRNMAALFLLDELRGEPKPMKEVEVRAREFSDRDQHSTARVQRTLRQKTTYRRTVRSMDLGTAIGCEKKFWNRSLKMPTFRPHISAARFTICPFHMKFCQATAEFFVQMTK